tara:strand:+ start:2732 stop:3316 length:585 start_codon:yes stop_codon:yes gene_type:complete
MKFKGKNYTEVKDRIDAFLSEYPEATIDNMLVSVNSITDTPTGERCNEYMVRSTVYPDKENKPDQYYVGHAAERDNTGFVNKTSALENCETSAAGRALAFAGYGGGYAIASKEEVENAKTAQKKSHVTVKMLEELDAGFKKATPYLDEAMIKRYNEQRSAGHFDTKLRVNATMQYFNQMIKEGKDVGKDKKDAK